MLKRQLLPWLAVIAGVSSVLVLITKGAKMSCRVSMKVLLVNMMRGWVSAVRQRLWLWSKLVCLVGLSRNS